MKPYYITQAGCLVGRGVCQPGNEAAIQTSGGELHWGVPPARLQPPPPFHDWDAKSRAWRLNQALAWAAVRAERDTRLAACDWTTLADVPLTDERRAAWFSYRQALRDITKQADPAAIRWPVAPE